MKIRNIIFIEHLTDLKSAEPNSFRRIDETRRKNIPKS